MKSFNQVTLLGNVAGEPDIKTVNTRDGEINVARFSLATSTGGYKKTDGTDVPEETQFHRVTAWRKLADTCKNFIHKGDTLLITGEIKYNQVEKDGVKTTYTDIIADFISICRSKNGAEAGQQGYAQQGNGGQYQRGGQPQYTQGGYPQYPQQGGYPQYPQQGGYQQYPQGGQNGFDPRGGNAPY